jgi:hypothetical protein
MELPGTIWIALFLLVTFVTVEVLNPKIINEGFKLVSASDISGEKSNFFSQFALRRGDIGIDKEEKNFIQDPRYFRGYVDVQNFGFKHDFCRMVVPEELESSLNKSKLQNSESDKKKFGNNTNMYFACALAGTSGLSSTSYRTKSVKDGFRISRDDYMRDIYNENKYAYCRILKANDAIYQPLCLRAKDSGFNDFDEVDSDPPEEIKAMLQFYDGIVAWLRFRDDMADYANALTIQKSGAISIPEDPNPSVTRGVSFNGIDQFLRISDAPDLTLGRKISIRSVRAFSMWVFFDEFTNNAHIFDFGDGPGNNNTVLSIIGKGDETVSTNEIRSNEQNTLPDYPSGPHPCSETTPQNLMLLKANVNEYECKLFDTIPNRMSWDTGMEKQKKNKPTRASLLYEVWDSKQRKQRIKVNGVIPLKKWCHIVVTAKSNDSFRPDIAIYINGTQVHLEPSGYLPQARSTTNNYIGKSNWANASSQYELKDELFNGKVFDFRMYNNVMGEEKIKKTISWGMEKLGIK